MRTSVVALVIVALIGAVIYLGLFLRWPAERPLAYWSIDDRTLEVVLMAAPQLNCGIAQVSETSDAVRIHAQCLERVIPVPQTGMAQKYIFRTTLQAPLGSRVIYDGLGNIAEKCQLPGLECYAPG